MWLVKQDIKADMSQDIPGKVICLLVGGEEVNLANYCNDYNLSLQKLDNEILSIQPEITKRTF